jgi:hypothetical protein
MSSNLAEAGFAFIMAIAFAIIGLRAAKVRSDRLALWNSARNWPTVSAKLLEVGIDIVTKGHNRLLFDTYYRPRIVYSYSVGGRAYTGTKFDCTDSPGDTQIRTRARLSKYSPGDSAIIAYDPADPHNSVFHWAIKPLAVVDDALSIYLGFFAAIFLIAMGVRILT